MKKIYTILTLGPLVLLMVLACEAKLKPPPKAKIKKIPTEKIENILITSKNTEASQKVVSLLDEQTQINLDANPPIKEYLKQIETVTSIEKYGLSKQYGGFAGREYFKAYTSYILIPLLTEFIKEILKAEQEITINFLGILSGLLEWAGKQRKELAEKTFTPSGDRFGSLVNDGDLLSEPIHSNSFAAWNQKIRRDLTEFFSNDEILKESIKESHSKWPHNIQDKHYTKAGHDIVIKGNWSKLKVTMIGEPKSLSTTMSIRLKLNQENRIGIIFLNEEAAKIQIRHHGKHSLESPWISDEITKAAVHFGKIATLTNSKELKNELGYLFRLINISSIYARGQAAISEWLIKSIANARGYAIKFSPEWTGPENPNPDQHALSTLNFDEYIKAFNANVFLEPISLP